MLPEQQQQILSKDDWIKIDTFLVPLQLGKKCLGEVKVRPL